MTTYRVLLIGGYGFFGRRLAERLALRSDLHVLIAGRSVARADQLRTQLRGVAQAELSAVDIDATSATLSRDIRRIAPDAVVHTSGPFQGQDYRVARACIEAQTHYIDLADGRGFVSGISALDSSARSAAVAVISGASSVPALSTAAVDFLAAGMSAVRAIDIGISPGNQTDRGLATVQAVLGYCGKPLPTSGVGSQFGWVGSYRHAYPARVGIRLLSPCDVPDLTLLPSRYAGTPSIRFGAGLELGLLHRGMNVMAWLTRHGMVADWSAHAHALQRVADWFKTWGSDAGAMHVRVTGMVAGIERGRLWHLLATHGQGPYVPTLAASALVRKLQEGESALVGARPCMGLLTLEDFQREAEGLRILMTEEQA